MANTESYYTQYWRDGIGDWSPKHLPVAEDDRRILSTVKASDRVLDIGCGDGRIADYLIGRGVKTYLGIDVSPRAVEICAARGIPCRQHDLNDPLPFPVGSLECVTIFEVLEHLFDPENCASEILRVLKPGGMILGSVPNIAYLPNRLLFLCGLFNPGGSPSTSLKAPWKDPHIRFFTVNSLAACLAQSGFQQITITGESFSLTRMPILYRTGGHVRRLLSAISAPFGGLGRTCGALFGSRLYFSARKPS